MDTQTLVYGTLLRERIDAGPSGSVFHAALRDARVPRVRLCIVKLPPLPPTVRCPAPLRRVLRHKARGRLRVERDNALAVVRARGAHPGFAHMHPVVHFNARIPMLVSRGADGTIEDMRAVLDEQSPEPQWRQIAWQLSEAMAFLFEEARLAHVDIRPRNVLYVRRDDACPHVWLSDYGDLCPADEDADFGRGDDAFKPRPTPGARQRDHALFAYLATLLDLFLFRIGREHEAHITQTGRSVSAFLESDGYGSDLMRRLPRTHTVRSMVLTPLRGDLLQLEAHFYESLRPWLRCSLQASAA